ncbi:MAG TPA: histidinol-phosphatase HisJ family protein [Clostridiales bacterium]|jgi:histidinol-phosphatase (PHP family)|nr:histidinol-phosphatase HisJ family protein [Clostridiales bacterium]
MIKFDLHTHTNFSFDSEQDICELILRAKKLGLKYLAITDHFDNSSKYSTPELDISRYCQTLESFIGLAKNQSVNLLIGIEMGYMPAQNSQNEEIVRNYPFDYIINSVHEIDGIDCYFPEYHQGKDKRSSYMAYFERILDSLDAPYYYSAVGHLGYVIRKAPYNPKEYKYCEFEDILDKILKKIIQKQKILEINTSADGLQEPTIPSLEVIKRYYELGGRLVTFGSDAHNAQKLAHNFETVSKILKDIGFKYYTITKNRQNFEIKI